MRAAAARPAAPSSMCQNSRQATSGIKRRHAGRKAGGVRSAPRFATRVQGSENPSRDGGEKITAVVVSQQ